MSSSTGINDNPPLVQIAVTNLMETASDNMDSGSEHEGKRKITKRFQSMHFGNKKIRSK